MFVGDSRAGSRNFNLSTVPVIGPKPEEHSLKKAKIHQNLISIGEDIFSKK